MIKRVFVTKKDGFDIDAKSVLSDIRENLNINSLRYIHLYNRYDIQGIDEKTYEKSIKTIFSQANIDDVYEEKINILDGEKVFAVEYLPGQYDQRADFASQSIQIISGGIKPIVRCAKVFVINKQVSYDEICDIKKYLINNVDSRECELEKPKDLNIKINNDKKVRYIKNFIQFNNKQLSEFLKSENLAMNIEDLKLIQKYFIDKKRNPSETEIMIIDTYWSDHCRHTTFMTKINSVKIESGKYSEIIKCAYEQYIKSREFVYGDVDRDINLMDMATICMKKLIKKGMLKDLDVSDEINACSINIDVNVDGKMEKYLLMFKNETHNHPTEIEPFGGAATCLGGAIRDPLSGRSYVYQAMRITGSADPRQNIKDTLNGKLPQKKITTDALSGYSSYGNQIGVPTGFVQEVYDDGFVAKRMEVGAVIGATPKENVVRDTPRPGDLVLIVGGRTGRDGCSGATGSSKEHKEDSIDTCSAQVQKGDPVQERKLQRLFRNKNVAKMIKRCNDFGAGGVCVAIGEIAESVDINLDNVLKKYEGLTPTEIAISESQERMAVVIDKENIQKFEKICDDENIETSHVATVQSHKKIRMYYNKELIVDIDREFLNTNGAKQSINVIINDVTNDNYFKLQNTENIKQKWIDTITDLNVCSQRGIIERFDSSIGASSVLMPLGGKYQATPTEGMVAKIPVLSADTSTCSIMSFGYNPKIGKYSPFHGAFYAVLESVCKIVAMGGDYKNIRLSFQEYFEKLGKDYTKWGKPFSALLGANYVCEKLGIAPIGGKDSMSGTFKDINVPATLISFAVTTEDIKNIISPEFKRIGSKVIFLKADRDDNDVVDIDKLKKNLEKINSMIKLKKVISAYTVKCGGICEAISKMSFGNKIGIQMNNIDQNELFGFNYGSFVLEVDEKFDCEKEFDGYNYKLLGNTISNQINVGNISLLIDDLYNQYLKPLDRIFPVKTNLIKDNISKIEYKTNIKIKSHKNISKPRVFIPVFPGTNCEYDCQRAFEKEGALVSTSIFKNLSSNHINESIMNFEKLIKQSQILMLPGGFSAGDEPDGSAKFISVIFRNERIKNAIYEFLNTNDGLILGICNGFQALVKLGLLPYSKIREIDDKSVGLTYNNIGRHMSKIVRTKITSNKTPWLYNCEVGETYNVAISHGEGRFVCSESVMVNLIENGMACTQYVDFDNEPTYDSDFNPNGSYYSIESICSEDGRIYGKMGHSERYTNGTFKNIVGESDQKIFKSGVQYFTK